MAKAIETGYSKISRGGLQAFRVPIENFAGILKNGESEVAPLQLVVDAVEKTKDYSVFGSHKYGRLAHEREVDAAHPQPVDVNGWVEAQSAVESASETHGDAIE